MADPRLRRATPADAPALAALSIEVWLGTYLKRGIAPVFAEFALTTFTADAMATAITSPDDTLIVSDNREGIDGYIRVTRNRPAPVEIDTTTEITTLYVQPRHHGTGIGAALLQTGLETVQDQAVWLATNAENTPAIGFYLKHGFDQVGETQFVIDGTGYLNNVYAKTLRTRT